MDWRPIESVPRDGTKILLAQDEKVEVGSWHAEDTGYFETVSSGPKRRVQEWVQTSSGYWDGTEEIFEPTHWMPLPKPPEK